eukprot:RCo009262
MPELISVLPKEGLFFPPPLNRIISNMITLRNVSATVVTFKIKTTSPTSYVVKPRMGVLQPSEEAKVRITLRAQPEPEAARAKDRFQVEVRPLSDGERAQA